MKILKILDRNKVLRFKGRQIRTPVDIKVTEKDLKVLKVILLASDIKNYKLVDEEYKDPIPDLDLEDDIEENVIVEELEIGDSPTTILEKLIRNGENE
jgi:hypothetical protein